MEDTLHADFISFLERHYGVWDRNTSKFGTTAFGMIAHDLCMSKSHFSLLISGNGTKGMYQRAQRKVQQVAELARLKQELVGLEAAADVSVHEANVKRLQSEILELEAGRAHSKRRTDLVKWGAIGVALITLLAWAFQKGENERDIEGVDQQGMLQLEDHQEHHMAYFFEDTDSGGAVSPYLGVGQVQEYCPASAYEGKWELADRYIIPLPYKLRGLYYVACSGDLRMKCEKAVSEDEKGYRLLGFEKFYNQLWFDTEQTPISPDYFDAEKKEFSPAFFALDFENDSRFVKLADIHSCFFNHFTIGEQTISRRGEACGRKAIFHNEAMAKELRIDIQEVLDDAIGAMDQVSCHPAINQYCDPNDLEAMVSTIDFSCMFSAQAENLGFGGAYPYQKSYRLVEQNYSDNLLCKRCVDQIP